MSDSLSNGIDGILFYTTETTDTTVNPPTNSFLNNVKTYFREYCNCTSIHGFRYFGEKRTIFERIWWIIIFLISLTACAISIYGVYMKWEGSPVIVNFANQGTPVYIIPFPAVTICPQSKSHQNLFSYTKIMQKKLNNSEVTPDEDTKFEYMSLVCKYHDTLSYSNPDTFPDTFFDVLDSVKPDLILQNCMYLSKKINCSELFVPIITDEGICYTFNMLDRSEIYKDSVIQYKNYQRSLYARRKWSVEHGYTEDAIVQTYPKRGLFAGAANGLILNIFTPPEYLDYACRPSALQGYKVLLHIPVRVPRPSQQYFRVPLDQSVVGAVQPVMISTSERVQMYNAKKRGCHFPLERHLKFFKIYTSLNCKIECLTNYTLTKCGCVNFYMPRENGTKICGTGKIPCMQKAENYMQIENLYLKLRGSESTIAGDCRCLPICTDVTYDVDTSQTDWDWKNSYKASMLTPSNDIRSFTEPECNEYIYGMENSNNTVEDPTKNSFWKNVRTYFREYCNCTSIHGFRYFGEKRTIFERIWWTVVFLICLTACASSIYGVYMKWEGSPVIVNFANQGTPVYSIPFPAVTICPEAKSDQNAFSYTKIMQNKLNESEVTPDEETAFEYMSLVCKYHDNLTYSNANTFPDTFFDVLDSVKPDLILQNCMYLGKTINCSELFAPIITDEGICYTFNMLNRSEIYRDSVIQYKDYQRSLYARRKWSVEHGYAEDAVVQTYPKRGLFAGAANGLILNIFTPPEYLDYACRPSALQGYKVLLHIPVRVPRPSQQYFRVPLDQSVVGAVQPVMISTSEKVQMYKPTKRGCHFPLERHLKFFKIYTSLNCKIECLTNYTLTKCGCVNFYMPRENGTKICGTGKISCMQRAEQYMQTEDLHLKLEGSRVNQARSCRCLPLCTDVTYEVETSQTDWDWKNAFKANMLTPSNNSHLSSLTIFFKSDSFVTSERNELYGPIDFLANFGGLLGLFTGFSVLSLMEILYFSSIRLICNTRLYGYWAGPET